MHMWEKNPRPLALFLEKRMKHAPGPLTCDKWYELKKTLNRKCSYVRSGGHSLMSRSQWKSISGHMTSMPRSLRCAYKTSGNGSPPVGGASGPRCCWLQVRSVRFRLRRPVRWNWAACCLQTDSIGATFPRWQDSAAQTRKLRCGLDSPERTSG